eukprot:364937-Chlamydomonas_euryale.AAC.16
MRHAAVIGRYKRAACSSDWAVPICGTKQSMEFSRRPTSSAPEVIRWQCQVGRHRRSFGGSVRLAGMPRLGVHGLTAHDDLGRRSSLFGSSMLTLRQPSAKEYAFNMHRHSPPCNPPLRTCACIAVYAHAHMHAFMHAARRQPC